jgi:hypothetical protein
MAIAGKGGRPLGLPKTGGRARGTPNRATRTVAEKLEALGCDPIEGMARIAMDENNSAETRGRYYSELAQYVFPKRKPIEISNEESLVINVNTSLDNSGDSSDVRDKCKPDAQATPSSGI